MRAIVGNDAVVDKPDELLVYECDAYTLEKNPPNAVVLPRTTEQVSQIVKLCAALKRAHHPARRGHQPERLGARGHAAA